MVITGSKFDLKVGRSGLNFLELEHRDVAPHAECIIDGAPNVIVTQIRCKVQNPAVTRRNATLHNDGWYGKSVDQLEDNAVMGKAVIPRYPR